MAIKEHLETLTQRHQELEAAIASEIKHPCYDELRVIELKRQKLKIKDQLQEYQLQTRMN